MLMPVFTRTQGKKAADKHSTRNKNITRDLQNILNNRKKKNSNATHIRHAIHRTPAPGHCLGHLRLGYPVIRLKSMSCDANRTGGEV